METNTFIYHQATAPLACSSACSTMPACRSRGQAGETFSRTGRSCDCTPTAPSRIHPEIPARNASAPQSCTTYCNPATTCNGHGSCNVFGKCLCDLHFTGDHCNECTQVRVDFSWVGGYTHFTGNNCTSCETNYFGSSCATYCNATTTCSGNGTCDTDTGQCSCNDGYFGPSCATYCNPNSTCTGHGSCDPSSGQCRCEDRFGGVACDTCYYQHFAGNNCTSCETNYFGSSCATYCNATTTCSGNGTCNTDTGQCACNDGYFGPSCATYCNPNSTCTGHGSCDPSSGQCRCEDRFGGVACDTCYYQHSTGANCDICEADYFGSSCTTYCNPSTTCSGHGTCNNTGQCACSDGYYGTYAAVCGGGIPCGAVSFSFSVASGPCTVDSAGSCVGRPDGYSNSESCSIRASGFSWLAACPIFSTESGYD
jgi:hypothetical protein